MTGLVHDPVALGLAVLAVLIVVVGFATVLALCAAAAYGDELASNTRPDPQAAAALDELGDTAEAMRFDFPTGGAA